MNDVDAFETQRAQVLLASLTELLGTKRWGPPLVWCPLSSELGREDEARADLEWCFRLTDVLETERTSLVILFSARLGCAGPTRGNEEQREHSANPTPNPP